MPIEHNPEYIHHTEPGRSSVTRELVFGMEDGMVSTLGAVTGIALATQDVFTTILSGLIVIGVESISMGVGSYLSSKSVRDIAERKLIEEREELKQYPGEEKEELVEMYVRDGWSAPLARRMVDEAAGDPRLFLQEMAYRELKIFPTELENPLQNGLVMGVSYIVGGAVPIITYFFLPLTGAAFFSIMVTFIGLFGLGVYTTKLSKRAWWRAGLEMVVLAGLAALVGYAVGQTVDTLWLRR